MADSNNSQKHLLTFKVSPEFYQALTTMATASGLTGGTAASHFAVELLEVAIIEAYRARFNTTITGAMIDKVIEPQTEEGEDEQD